MPIDKRVLEVAGTDDYVNRRYVEQRSGQVVDFYLAYTARPANMLGHRPSVCYRAHGWNSVATKPDRVTLADGTELECLIHYFMREQPGPAGLVVLNYYILQGQHTTEWTDFWGPKWRRPNLSRDANYYVAQVQIAAARGAASSFAQAEDRAKRFAAGVAPLVAVLLPSGEASDVPRKP